MNMDEKTELSSTDPTAEILEPVSLVDEIGCQVMDTSSTSAGTEDAGSETQTQTSISIQQSEPEDDANTLISELNDVTLTTGNADADNFLEALTSQNTTECSEASNSGAPASVESESSNISLPTLALSMEDIKDEENKEKSNSNEEKDPVCSLEEELQRMHEGSLIENENKEEVKVESEEVQPKSDDSKEKVEAPIMRDSDLEEMLAADEILHDSNIIKASQNDIKHIDVLVCGKCHEAFSFIEEFQQHKSEECSAISNLISTCEFESKPQVWGFVLWKNKQIKLIKEDETLSDWEVYKKWCELSKTDKDPWISAGQTLQYFTKIGNSKLAEVKTNKGLEDQSLDGLGDNKENSTLDSSKSPLVEVKTVINNPKTVSTIHKVNDPNSNRAIRTVQTAQKCEYAVERIVAKRFNPKKKTWEYQIKWEHFPSEENTWEPLSNLNHCRQMVDEFEEQLKKLKAEKHKQQALNAAKSPQKIKAAGSSPTSSLGSKGLIQNRPQRTSKQKALDQVKAWCGNISDEDSIGMKRSRSPDSDESFEKRMKFEDNSDDSDSDMKPKVYRKIAPKPTSSQNTSIQVLKNGLGRNTPLPQNILIPDANGVVRINQKQLPSLSTGVYIMSKTAGIIKLDSNTSKVATSGGQTIVKVAPKIGQTQIKILKKDGTTTQQIVQTSPKNIHNTPKAMQKHLAKAKKVVSDLKPSSIIKKTDVVKKQPVILSSKDMDRRPGIKKLPDVSKKSNQSASENSKDEDSDDGLEELPFPDEIKIPEPEENEDTEFTLDPSTGKIAGVEYPDVPDPEPIEEPKSEMSLDNIVKLAAADITEEDLKNEPQESMDVNMQEMGLEHVEEEFEQKVKFVQKTEHQALQEQHKRFVTASPMKQVVKMSVTPRKVSANPTSILNKALTSGPQVVRRTIVGGTPTQRVQQRILNQSVARNPQAVGPVVRQVNTYVRTKPVAPKPKFNISSESKFVRPVHENSPKNVYTYSRPVMQSSSAKKIGNTTIRSAHSGSGLMASPHQKTQTKIVRTSTGLVQRIVSSPAKKDPMIVRGQPEKIERKNVQMKPKTVISMPSLMSDDELLLTAKPSAQQKMKSPPGQNVHHQEYNVEDSTMLVAQENTDPVVGVVSTGQEPEEMSIAVNQDQAVAALAPDMSSFTLADNDNPIFITGDDGTVYQVAGQNEQGQTILLTQGADGQQQCLLVTNEVADAMETSATEEMQPQSQEISMPDISTDVTEPLSVKTDPIESSDQVVAQVVRAEPPSPGGTHKVVVMLPDGNLMVTQVSPEEYASLELE